MFGTFFSRGVPCDGDWKQLLCGVLVNHQAPEELVMSTADEYRERSEEYQLIQSAIPTYEKFSSDG